MPGGLHVAGAGPPIVLLHGLGGTADVWQPLVADLAQDHRVICPDLLGFGFSDKPRDATYTPARHGQAIGAVLDALGLHQLDALVGHSCGGVVAVAVLAGGGVTAKRLALASTPYPSPRFPERDELLHSPLDRTMLAWTPLAHLIHMTLALCWPLLGRIAAPPELRGAWAGYMDHTIASYVGTAEACLFRADLDPLLPKLHALPTLLLYARQDRTVPPLHGERLAAALPHSQYQLIEGDHFALLRGGRAMLHDWLTARSYDRPETR